MKILFVSLYDSRFGLGGAERVALDLAYTMRDQYGDEIVFCINPGDAAEELKQKGVRVFEIPYEKSKTFQLISTLGHVIREFKPDVAHSHHRYTTFLLDIFFKKKTKILHTEEVFRRDKKWAFRYGHFAVACHEAVRKNLTGYYGVPENKTVTILNAVTRPQPDPVKVESLRKTYPKEQTQLDALCIARLEGQKGHTYLIEAVALLTRQERNKFRIFMAGDGTLKQALVAQAKEKGVSDTFIFLGYCREAAEFLSLCDFTLLPSVWEGSPLTILLSFGAGKPVVGTDIDGIRDVVVPGENGLLAQPKDPASLAEVLRKIAKNPDLLRSLKTESSWKHYSSMERTAGAYRTLYQKLLKSQACCES